MPSQIFNTLLMASTALAVAAPPFFPGSSAPAGAAATGFATPSFITSHGVTYIAIPAAHTTIPIGGTLTATVTITPVPRTVTVSVPPTQIGTLAVNKRDLEKRQRRPVIGRHSIYNYVHQPRPTPAAPFVPPFANVTVPATARVQTTTVTVTAATPTVTATATCSAINVNVNVNGAGNQVEPYIPIFIGAGVTAINTGIGINAQLGVAIVQTLAVGLDACSAIAACATLTANDVGVFDSFEVYLLNGRYQCAQYPGVLDAADFSVVNVNVGASYGYALPAIVN